MVEMIPTLINGRWELLLPSHRAGRAEWWTGWEKERLASMHEHLTALIRARIETDADDVITDIDLYRPVIIDVGAEEGDFPALWSSWGCDVVLIEPNPKVWPNIKAIWEANELRQPRLCFVGFASDHNDLAPKNNTVRSAGYLGRDGWPFCADGPVISNHGFRHLAEQADSTPGITLDDLLSGPIDAITIDVEGAELRVLEGARRILREDRPLVWVSCHIDYEWNDTRYGGLRPDDVRRFMADLDYVDTHLATDHEQHWLFEPSERI